MIFWEISQIVLILCKNMNVMYDEKEKIINNLNEKIKTIISFFERSKEENQKLFIEKQELLAQNKQKEIRIKELEKELEIAKFASAITKTDDEMSEVKHDAKIKINRMVREIDRCISLLNKLN